MMRGILLSAVVAGLGVLVSRSVFRRLTGQGAERDPHVPWAIGLVALLPAWIVAFLALLGGAPVRRPETVIVVSWTVSAALALVATIITEARMRREVERAGSRHPPALPWRLGVVTLVPALLVAWVGLAAR